MAPLGAQNTPSLPPASPYPHPRPLLPRRPINHLLLISLPGALIRLVLFLPPLLLFTRGYIIGRLSARWLTSNEEEEAQAQFKAVGGGLGVMAAAALLLGLVNCKT